jgi:anthranilate synthase component 1
MESVRLNFEPEFSLFSKGLSSGTPQIVWVRLPADMDTPVSAMMRLRSESAPCFLLESVEKGEVRGRYSVIGLMPDVIWRCFGNRAEIAHDESLAHAAFKPCDKPSLDALRELIEASQFTMPDGLPPIASGLVGYMTYDTVRLMEQLPEAKPDTIGVPDAIFVRPKIMVIFDSVTDTMTISTVIWPNENRGDATTAYDAAKKRIVQVVHTLNEPLVAPLNTSAKPTKMEDFTSNTTRADYDAMIESAKEHIVAGDIFQVVLSQRFSAPFTLSPFALYRALRYLNPSPFLFYLDFCDFQIVGSSPEILVRLRDDEVTIRPIAGTRKRGKTKTEDAELAADLLADPKELAEHLMLLDLGRNDVGRVAKIGSVHTTKQMEIENYSHVMHIVSNVVGTLDEAKYDGLSALVAGFPAGTVSGAPKVRAMQIINKLEQHKRSFYAGCVGYFSSNGDMDTCITLRTGLVKDGMLHLQAGGGIVAESTAEGEYQESLNKAKALMRAAEVAIEFS